MSKFKVGDQVKIIGNRAGHDFPIGATVMVMSTREGDFLEMYRVKDLQGAAWYTCEEDMEMIEEKPKNGSEWHVAPIDIRFVKTCTCDAQDLHPMGNCICGTPVENTNSVFRVVNSAGEAIVDVLKSSEEEREVAKKALIESGILDKRQFESGAVRDTNEGKSRPDLISPYFTNRLGHRLAFGAKKYSERNWEKGIPDEAFLESLERHLVAYKMGLKDEDHAGAIAFNIMGIIHNEEIRKLKENDLP